MSLIFQTLSSFIFVSRLFSIFKVSKKTDLRFFFSQNLFEVVFKCMIEWEYEFYMINKKVNIKLKFVSLKKFREIKF